LYYEMAFYAVFAVCLIISVKHRCLLAFIGLSGICLCGLFFGADWSIFFEIAGGMGAFYLLKRLYEVKNTRILRIICVSVAAISFGCLICVEKFELFYNAPRFVRLGIPAFVFVISFVKATQGLKLPKPFIFCGDISFSLYLMQLDVLAVLKGALIVFGAVPNEEVYAGGYVAEKILVTIIGILLTFAVSLVTYDLIEKRFTNFLKIRLLK